MKHTNWKAQVLDQIAGLSLVNDGLDVLRLQNDGKSIMLRHCCECGAVWEGNETPCSHWQGRYPHTQDINEETHLRVDGTGSSLMAFELTQYDVRSQKLVFKCHLFYVLGKSLLSRLEQAKLAMAGSARVWDRDLLEISESHTEDFEITLECDIHQVVRKRTRFVRHLKAKDFDFSDSGWTATFRELVAEENGPFDEAQTRMFLTGDPDTFEQLRLHHYPVDDGAALFRYLLEQADGKGTSRKKNGRTSLKKQREQLQAAALRSVMDVTADELFGEPASIIWQLDATHQDNFFWCPERDTVIPISREEFDRLDEGCSPKVCPVCGKQHTVACAHSHREQDCWTGFYRVEKGDDGELRFHFVERKETLRISYAAGLDKPEVTSKMKIENYWIAILGADAYTLVNALNPDDSPAPSDAAPRMEPHSSWRFRENLRALPGQEDILNLLKDSQIDWMHLDRLKTTGEDESESESFLKEVFVEPLTGRESFFSNIYRTPALAELLEQGWTQHFWECVGRTYSSGMAIQDLLEVDEATLPLLTPDYYDHGDRCAIAKRIVSLYPDITPEELQGLTRLGTEKGFLIRSDVAGLLKIAVKPAELMDYARACYMHQCIATDSFMDIYTDYLRRFLALGMTFKSDREKFPSSLRKECDRLAMLINSLDRAAIKGVSVGLTELKKEVVDAVSISPEFNPRTYVRDVFRMSHDLEMACNALEDGAVLRLEKDGQTDSLAYLAADTIVALKGQNERLPDKTVRKALKVYADRFGLKLAVKL